MPPDPSEGTLPPPISHGEAQRRLLALAQPLGPEEVAAGLAGGRVLAAPLTARRTQPAADLSAMDGYAVRPDDLSGPWRIVGESAAGRPFAPPQAHGEAVRISTGAVVPGGADAILLQEDALREGERLCLKPGARPEARHIRRQGFDFREGEVLIEAGARIGAAQLALAIAAGHARLAVGRRARAAVIDSGDELVADPASASGALIPASNGAMLAAMAAPLAAEVTRLGPVPDRLEALVAALEAAGDAEVIVTSGGASVGDHDLVRPALERWGAGIDFWRIAMRPGKPLLVARKGTQIVLGLPGNPVSSYVTAFLFMLPLLRRLAGDADPLPRAIALPLAAPIGKTGERAEFLRATLTPAGVAPLPQQDSSALATLARAQALIERPAGAPPARVGEMVSTYLLAC